MLRYLLALSLICTSAFCCGCTRSIQETLADLDHSAFALYQPQPVDLAWSPSGNSLTLGELDAAPHSRLAKAWNNGRAPNYGLTGQQHAQDVRVFGGRTIGDVHQAFGKVLLSQPSRVWLILDQGNGPKLLAKTETLAWGEHAHFAEVALPFALSADDILSIYVTDIRGRHAEQHSVRFIAGT